MRKTLQRASVDRFSPAEFSVFLLRNPLPGSRIVVEARHMEVSLSTMRNKTDRIVARGIAQMMRLGWYRAIVCTENLIRVDDVMELPKLAE